MHVFYKRLFRLSCWPALCLLVGCDDAPKYPHARVAGVVTIRQQPIHDGSVSFIPKEKGPAVGARIVDGRFDCPHVPIGKHQVTFHAMRETGKFDTVGNISIPIKESIIPPKSQGGFVLDVTRDQLEQRFDLH